MLTYTWMPRLEHCHYCNGPIDYVVGPGRFEMYRGVQCEVPSDLAIPTCKDCGRQWISDEEIGPLSKSFEEQRLRCITSHKSDS